MEFLKHPIDAPLQTLIERRASRIFSPLEWLIRKQAAASVLLLFATVMALFLANSPWGDIPHSIAVVKAGIFLYDWELGFSIHTLVNDGLLSLFFLLLGLEIKREVIAGHLNEPRKVAFIVFAALGGMVVPALIYYTFNSGESGQAGWAIPMATDTAFAIGVLALLAKRVSISVTIFLTALAIFDDIGAILVIAIFYAEYIDMLSLLWAALTFLLLAGANLVGVRNVWIYTLLGIVLWWFVHQSGLHATLAGLLIALTIPARSRISQRSFITIIREQILALENNTAVDNSILKSQTQHMQMANMENTVHSASTPLQQWNTVLENPIAIIVLPLFAFFNAGIQLSAATIGEAYTSSVTQGIIAGLVIGKPLGVVLFCLLAIKLRLGAMPEGITFKKLAGIGMLAGIGFTMSLFISILSFGDQVLLHEEAKIGILTGSVISAFLGSLWFYFTNTEVNGEPLTAAQQPL